MRRFFTILMLAASLAVAGHFALMSVMPQDHSEHGHEAQTGMASCPLGIVCLSTIGSVADLPAVAAWVVAAIVMAFAGAVIIRSTAIRPHVPVRIRTGTRFPELLSIFKRE